jgi:hypothetical protein
MSEQIIPLYHLGENDRVIEAMVYTSHGIIWGEVLVKQAIRSSIWLKLNSAPDHMCFYNARMIYTVAGGPPKPVSYPELHIPVPQIAAYHLIPPAVDLPEIDAKEVNIRMEPVTVLSGTARIDGFLRLTGRINIGNFMDITKEVYSSVFDADISHPVMPGLRPLHVPHLLVRQITSIFCGRHDQTQNKPEVTSI